MDLSNRATVSSKVPELDSLYVYKTNHEAEFTHREQLGTGYRYKSNKALMSAGEDEIHVYHQTVEIDGVTKGITLVTKNDDEKAVKEFFKGSIELIENTPQLIKSFKSAKSTPQELSIRYTY